MLEKIKKLREQTGAGMVEIKKALTEAEGDEAKAIEILREKGLEKASKKATRETQEGVVASYIHSNGRVGAMVKLLCETDFVARNDEFKTLAVDIAMHITAMKPQAIRPEEVSAEAVANEKAIWLEQLKEEKKPEQMIPGILDDQEKKFREEISLMTQAFVKDPDRTVGDVINEKIAKIGENIQIGEFSRLEL
ncbi:MAG: translation elongation factor Ts [Parcubacteria group bacterium]